MRLSPTLGLVAFATLVASPTWADGLGTVEDGVPSANLKGITTSLTLIDPDFRTSLLATRTDTLENPSGVITNYGMLSNGTLTEADQNTYVVLQDNPGGPSLKFDYGRHFLFQPHEHGNIYVIEDVGGATSPTTSPINLKNAKQPNSFVYRYIPNNPGRIEDG